MLHASNKFLDDEKEYKVPYREEDYARPYNWDRKNRTFPEGMEDHPFVIHKLRIQNLYCYFRIVAQNRLFQRNHRMVSNRLNRANTF
ncbi:MAG: hypothetical protein C4B58_09365 [Deltaproteobacteria bacterium]|nr:MAG: hypothetical protein C4B58_09365 [Deltaproteobacteria bacterium]